MCASIGGPGSMTSASPLPQSTTYELVPCSVIADGLGARTSVTTRLRALPESSKSSPASAGTIVSTGLVRANSSAASTESNDGEPREMFDRRIDQMHRSGAMAFERRAGRDPNAVVRFDRVGKRRLTGGATAKKKCVL